MSGFITRRSLQPIDVASANCDRFLVSIETWFRGRSCMALAIVRCRRASLLNFSPNMRSTRSPHMRTQVNGWVHWIHSFTFITGCRTNWYYTIQILLGVWNCTLSFPLMSSYLPLKYSTKTKTLNKCISVTFTLMNNWVLSRVLTTIGRKICSAYN